MDESAFGFDLAVEPQWRRGGSSSNSNNNNNNNSSSSSNNHNHNNTNTNNVNGHVHHLTGGALLDLPRPGSPGRLYAGGGSSPAAAAATASGRAGGSSSSTYSSARNSQHFGGSNSGRSSHTATPMPTPTPTRATPFFPTSPRPRAASSVSSATPSAAAEAGGAAGSPRGGLYGNKDLLRSPKVETPQQFFAHVQTALRERQAALEGTDTPPLPDMTVQLVISGMHWYIDACAAESRYEVRQGTLATPDCSVTMSFADLLGLARGTLSPLLAVAKRRIEVTGQRGLLQQLAAIFRQAVEEGPVHSFETESIVHLLQPAGEADLDESGGAQSGGGVGGNDAAALDRSLHSVLHSPASAQSVVEDLKAFDFGTGDKEVLDPALLSKEWVADEDRQECVACQASFNFLCRRHHCRMCGEIFCDDCTSYRYATHRLCLRCLRRSVSLSLQARKRQSQVEGSAQISQAQPTADAEAAAAGVVGLLAVRTWQLIEEARTVVILASASAAAFVTMRTGAGASRPAAIAAATANAARSSLSSSSSAAAAAAAEVKIAGSAHGGSTRSRSQAAGGKTRLSTTRQAAGPQTPHTTTTTTTNTTTTTTSHSHSSHKNQSPSASATAASSSSSFLSWKIVLLLLATGMTLGFVPSLLTRHLFPSPSAAIPPSAADTVTPTPDGSTTSSSSSSSSNSLAVDIVDFLVRRWWALALALVALAFWTTSRRLLVRRLIVYSVAVVVFGGYQLLKVRCRWFPVSEAVENARWDYLHDLFSRLVLRVIQRLEGFWVKVGQYLSARGDVMPEVWVQRLSSLQDELPPRPFSTIERQVVRELGSPMAELFSAFDPTPMATASIAQVHKATLRDGGRVVVVKVQHEGVDALMRQDMVNLERIMSWVAYFEPEFDFKPVVAEYTKAAVHELDFVGEAQNLRRVATNLLTAKIDVLVPLPIDHLVTRSVMVMEFMEGFKITQVEEFERYGIDRAAVVRRVCEAFAHQVFVAGFFNADPHPGNILINVDPITRKVRPVLLDYGLVKALDNRYRIAFAAMVASANNMDFGGLLRSFDMMGLILKRTDPLEDMRHIRFILRDTKPATEMRAEFSSFRNEQLSKLEKLPRNKRNPVEAWPADLLFFFRVLFLLRGLCARLNVRIKYLPVLAPYARWAIIQQFPSPQHALTALPPASVNATILEMRMRRLLKELYADNHFVGMQVAAYFKGKKILDVCGGTLSDLDPRPVTSETLFNCFSVSKAVSAIALHQLVEQRLLSYDDLVCKHWPEFAERGKQTTTVRHVLTHSAGLQEFPGRGLTLEQLCDWDFMLDAIARAHPTVPPGSVTQYHYLSFGWLIGGLVRAVTGGQHLRRLVRQRIAYPLGLENEMFLGLSAEDTPGDYEEDLRPRLAAVSNAFVDMTQDDALSPESLQQVLTQIRQTYVHRGPGAATPAAAAAAVAAAAAQGTASSAGALAQEMAQATDAQLREQQRQQQLELLQQPHAGGVTGEPPVAQVVAAEMTQLVPPDAPEDVRRYLQIGLETVEDIKREIAPEAKGWVFVQEKSGVRISAKKMPNNPLSMVKGEGLIKCPPEGVVSIVADQSRKAEWDKMFKGGRTLQTITEDCRVMYDSYNRIWPTAPRDFCSVAMIEWHTDGSVIMANRSTTHPDCPEVDGHVRGNVMLGGIVLRPLPESNYEHCHITYIMFIDVMGEIPTFVLNKIANDQPLCVAGLREVAERLPNKHSLVRRPPVLRHTTVGPMVAPAAAAGASAAPAPTVPGPAAASLHAVGSSAHAPLSAARFSTSTIRPASGEMTDPSNSLASLSASSGSPSPPKVKRQGAGNTATSGSADASVAATAAAVSARYAEIVNGPTSGDQDSATDGSLLVDPCMHNSDKIRQACLPSSNGHFTARALARLFAALAEGGSLDGAHILSPQTVEALSSVQTSAGPAAWGLGLRVFNMRRPNGRIEPAAIGHSGMGGSMVLCDPSSQFAIAVTVNKLTFERECTMRVINTVCNLLGLGALDPASAV